MSCSVVSCRVQRTFENMNQPLVGIESVRFPARTKFLLKVHVKNWSPQLGVRTDSVLNFCTGFRGGSIRLYTGIYMHLYIYYSSMHLSIFSLAFK